MHPPRPLPSGLGASFTVDRARTAGVTPARLRASDLSAPFHGTRATGEVAGLARLRLLLAVLPAHAFAMGSTAGAVWQLPLPGPLETRAFAEPMIGVPAPANRIRRPGIRGRSVAVDPAVIGTWRGVRIASPARTWIDLSAELSPADLVAVTDRLIHHRAPLCSLEDLRAEAMRHPRQKGAASRVRSLQLANDRSESRRESLLRVLLIEAGLPVPECNVEIWDGARHVARVDMLYREQRLVLEYQGDHHRDPDQWSRDQMRRAELEALGYTVTYVTRRDFDDPERLAARVRRLLAITARNAR